MSLTTYDERIGYSYLTVESIGRGEVRPSRLILWLDDSSLFENLPLQLRRLQARGLEVKLSSSFGPHTKYFPFVESTDTFDTPLVTADDDIIYPRRWLKRLWLAYHQRPRNIHAYRARKVQFRGEDLAPYESWPAASSLREDRLSFALGVSGVLYPPSMLVALKQRGRAFQECCPWADDIWLNHTALRSKHRVIPVDGKSVMFPIIPGSQTRALKITNVAQGRNDIQLSDTYSEFDIQLLRAARTHSA